jgi:type III pantothenate kinase
VSWLLLDAGNSALKWAMVDDRAPQWSAPGRPDAPAGGAGAMGGTLAYQDADFAARLEQGLSAAFAPGPGPAKVCSLVLGCAVAAPSILEAIDRAVARAMGREPTWVDAESGFDHDGIVLRNAYADPKRLGADRWYALIGARARVRQGAIAVVNAGTATTVDGVDESGNFYGGVIAPGLAMMRASLAAGTARLPLAEGKYVAHPADTDDAIWTGILEAQAGLIERRVQRIRESAGGAPQVVLAGGAAAQLAPLLQAHPALGTILLEPDVVLRGLWHRARAWTSHLPVSNPP